MIYATEHYAENYSFFMALLDFVPVILFLLAGLLMLKNLTNKLTKTSNVLLSSGVVMIFLAGSLKAIWKMIASLGICDFEPLNMMFLPTQSFGFIFLGYALISLMFKKDKGTKMLSLAVLPILATALAPYSGSIIFLTLMVIGEILIVVGLSYLAIKMNVKKAIIFFVLTFIFSMSMGALGALESKMSVTLFNWSEEIVNVISQLSLLFGCYLLDKNNCKDFVL